MNDSKVLKEALSIPNKINDFLKLDNNPYDKVSKLIQNKKIKYIVTIARGTSDCAALYGSYLFAKYLGLPTYSMPPSIITLEKSNFNFSEALVIVITQSGLSDDLIVCEAAARKMGAKTMILSNNANSPIVNKVNYFFNMYAGEEKSVAATKSFVLSLLIIIKIVFFSLEKPKIQESIKELGDFLLEDSHNQWNIDTVNNKVSNGFIISRGVGFAISNEISLKFKELCQEMIEPFSSAEVMHGPKSLIQNSFKLFSLFINDNSGKTVIADSKNISNYTNLFYQISSNKNNSQSFYYKSFKLTDLDPIIIMSKFYPWIIKYSLKKGLDPDKPRYLTKVTKTF